MKLNFMHTYLFFHFELRSEPDSDIFRIFIPGVSSFSSLNYTSRFTRPIIHKQINNNIPILSSVKDGVFRQYRGARDKESFIRNGIKPRYPRYPFLQAKEKF